MRNLFAKHNLQVEDILYIVGDGCSSVVGANKGSTTLLGKIAVECALHGLQTCNRNGLDTLPRLKNHKEVSGTPFFLLNKCTKAV